MIVPMKKLTLFIAESNVDNDLTQLGTLGVLHLVPFQPPKDESIDRVTERIDQMTKALNLLEQIKQNDSVEDLPKTVTDYANDTKPHDEVALTERILNLEQRIKQLSEFIQVLDNEQQFYQTWGEISRPDIEKLSKEGLSVRLYLATEKQKEALVQRDDIFVIAQNEQDFCLAQIALTNEKLDLRQVNIPKHSPLEIEKSKSRSEKIIENAQNDLKQLTAYSVLLQEALDERIRLKDVRSVQYSGVAFEEAFRYWKGYFPKDKEQEISELAKQNDWGYLMEEPSDEELAEVPTLVRSPRWVERIKPVMNFMGLVTGYRELDVSTMFMMFFTFFSGILVGDAGYGLVFLIITLLVHSKTKFKAKTEFGLIYTLSVSIVFWGVLTGTYFGSPEIAQLPFLKVLTVDKMASFGGDIVFVQKVMFIIGAIHLSIGHLQSALKLSNSIRAIGQIGWVFIVWGLYFVVNQMVLGQPSPSFTIWFFIGGAVLVSFFSSTDSNFFKGVIASFGSLPLSIISGFSDIISYIRLYAVGLATVLMANSFNEMAIGDGLTTVGSYIGAVIVLILGHVLNMILASMAVIVHGVRLNMLEYAGHAGVEFSGSKYLPFQLKIKKNNQ